MKFVPIAHFRSLAKRRIYCEASAITDGQGAEVTDYYEENAGAFIVATRHVDMSDARGRFLAVVPSWPDGPARILDAGSGSGRDALVFWLLGHDVEACDASSAMVAATQAHAALAIPQIRIRLPERLRNRLRSPERDRRLDQLLQRKTPALITWDHDAGRGL